jgi:hypothetical protein
MMNRLRILAAAFALVLTGFAVYTAFYFSGSAQRAARIQWEYSSIVAAYSFTPSRDKLNKIYGMAEICYLQGSGCRRTEIRHEIDYGAFLQERALNENLPSRHAASLRASEIAFQKAMSQLGAEGWEIVNEPNLPFETVDIDDYNKFEDKSALFVRSNTRAVYFKRLKTQ